MAIQSLNDYIAAAKQRVPFIKTAPRTTIAGMPFSVFDLAGNPGAGVLSAGNTANGIVPVAGQAGYPLLNTFGVGALGYVSGLLLNNTVVSTAFFFDRLWKAGAYVFNADVTLASQPNYDSRVPNLNYTGLEIWVEQVTAATGNQAVNVTYTNQAGQTGRQTGAVGIGAAPTIGRCFALPLQAGDTGVQRIERVVGSVATAGTFNVMVLRNLAAGTIPAVGISDIQDLLRTGLGQIYNTTALYALVMATSTSSGLPIAQIEVANA